MNMRKGLLIASAIVFLLGGVSCVAPPVATDLEARIIASATSVLEGETIQLVGAGENGIAPYIYRWSLESGPGDNSLLTAVVGETVHAGPLDTAGTYVFRLVVTDRAGYAKLAYLQVVVEAPDPGEVFEVVLSGPSNIAQGVADEFEATTGYEGDVTFSWAADADFIELDPVDGATTSVVGSEPGTFTLTVTMTEDGTGRTTTASSTIEVDEPGDMVVEVAEVADAAALEESQLEVQVTGGSGEFTYAWAIVSGDGQFDDDTSQTPIFTPNVEGTMILQVVVTDEVTNKGVADQVVIEVAPELSIPEFSVEVDMPQLASAGDVVDVTASAPDATGTLTYFWSAVSGDPLIDDVTSDTASVTVNSIRTTQLRVEVTSTVDDESRTETADVYIVAIGDENPVIEFTVEEYGSFQVELDAENAPVTVANFLSYVDEGFFEGLVIHRSEPADGGFGLIQGGGYDADNFADLGETKETHAPIINEASNGLSNIRASISMARTSDPNSATSQFFISTTDNSDALDYEEGANDGYAVFGMVTSGMDVVDALNEMETTPNGGVNIATEAVIITSVTRVDEG